VKAGALAVAAALAACGGVKLAGHQLVAPVGAPTVATLPAADDGGEVVASAPSRPGPAALAPRAATGCFVADRGFDRAPPSDAPVDPWRAVDRGRPRVLPHTTAPFVDDGEADERGVHARCTAAHDHCLRDCSWLVTSELPPYTTTYVGEYDASEDGFGPYGNDGPYQALRTLPVTRRNLDVGMEVVVTAEPPHADQTWTLGEVEAIDWAAGTLALRGAPRDAYDLAWARIVVLRYVNGGTVEVVNGLTRERIELDAAELVQPR
jgi:hypothetical protein